MSITHAFVNPKADGADATKTRPSDWNAAHTIDTPLTITAVAGDSVALEIHVTQAFDDDADYRFAIVKGGVAVVQFDEGGLDLRTVTGESGGLNFRMQEHNTLYRLHLHSRHIAGYDSTGVAYFHASEEGVLIGKMLAPPAQVDFNAVGQFQFKYDSTTGAPKLLLAASDNADNYYTVSIPLNYTVQTYAASNVTVDRTYDADATTTAELADVLGTLIADLRAQGIVA